MLYRGLTAVDQAISTAERARLLPGVCATRGLSGGYFVK